MRQFQIELVRFTPGIHYSSLSLYPITANKDDWQVFPLVLARTCGEQIPYGSLFAYLFRRFGYPNFGWDDLKEMSAYLLSTPLPDMILKVTPAVSDSTDLHFTFLVSGKMSGAIRGYERRDYTAWKDKLFAWIEKENLLPEWMDDFVAAINKDICPVSDWRQAFDHLSLFTREDDEYKYVGDWFKTVTDHYSSEVETKPLHYLDRPTLDWQEWPAEDPLKGCYQAAYETLLDLKTPVRVRDQAIDANGYVADERITGEVLTWAPSSGYPSGAIGNEAPEEFSEIHRLVYRLGEGDAKRGIGKIMELCGVKNAAEDSAGTGSE